MKKLKALLILLMFLASMLACSTTDESARMAEQERAWRAYSEEYTLPWEQDIREKTP